MVDSDYQNRIFCLFRFIFNTISVYVVVYELRKAIYNYSLRHVFKMIIRPVFQLFHKYLATFMRIYSETTKEETNRVSFLIVK